MNINEREFTFTLPDEAKGAESAIQAILDQHATFIQGGFANHVAPEKLKEEVEKRAQELLTAKEAEAKTGKTVEDAFNTKSATLFSKENTAVVKALINFKEIKTADEINTKLDEIAKQYPHLKTTVVAGNGAPLPNTTIVIQQNKAPEPEKTRRWVMGGKK